MYSLPESVYSIMTGIVFTSFSKYCISIFGAGTVVRVAPNQMAGPTLAPIGSWRSVWVSIVLLFYWIVGVHLESLPIISLREREDVTEKGNS